MASRAGSGEPAQGRGVRAGASLPPGRCRRLSRRISPGCGNP